MFDRFNVRLISCLYYRYRLQEVEFVAMISLLVIRVVGSTYDLGTSYGAKNENVRRSMYLVHSVLFLEDIPCLV